MKFLLLKTLERLEGVPINKQYWRGGQKEIHPITKCCMLFTIVLDDGQRALVLVIILERGKPRSRYHFGVAQWSGIPNPARNIHGPTIQFLASQAVY